MSQQSEVSFLYLSEPDMIAAGVLDMPLCLSAIEEVFSLVDRQDYLMGGPEENEHGIKLWFPKERRGEGMPVEGPDRRFMSLIGYLGGRFHTCGDKWYGSNPANKQLGLPRSILMLSLNDPDTGAIRAHMSANLVSAMRTGAVPGVAARYLCSPDAGVLALMGAGVISRTALKGIAAAMPRLSEVRVFDILSQKSQQFAEETSAELGIRVVAATSVEHAVTGADIVHFAASGAHKVRVENRWLKPDCLLILTGAAELDDACYLDGRVVADNVKMHQAWLNEAYRRPEGVGSISGSPNGQLVSLIDSGRLRLDQVSDLCRFVSGAQAPGAAEGKRTVVVTGGMALCDIAWGYETYQQALKRNIGQKLLLWKQPHLS